MVTPLTVENTVFYQFQLYGGVRELEIINQFIVDVLTPAHKEVDSVTHSERVLLLKVKDATIFELPKPPTE